MVLFFAILRSFQFLKIEIFILKPIVISCNKPATRLEWSSFLHWERLGKKSGNGRRKSCPNHINLNRFHIVAIPEIESPENETGQNGQESDNQKGISESVVNFVLDESRIAFE